MVPLPVERSATLGNSVVLYGFGCRRLSVAAEEQIDDNADCYCTPLWLANSPEGLESQGKKVAEEREGRLKEAKIGDNDEELAIASLEVSSEVVDALAKRGITHLFPIQVLSFLLCTVTSKANVC
jgi:hypothetical protein